MALFIDSCVLLSGLNRADSKFEITRQAYRRAIAEQLPLLIAVQNVAELWNVSTRPLDKNGHGLSTDFALKRVHILELLFQILPESDASYLVLRRLLEQYNVQGTSVHDARLVSVMITAKIEAIVTFNTRDFRRYVPEGIRIISPQELADGSYQ